MSSPRGDQLNLLKFDVDGVFLGQNIDISHHKPSLVGHDYIVYIYIYICINYSYMILYHYIILYHIEYYMNH